MVCRSVATIQGRPLGIRDETFDVRQPTVEDVANDDAPAVADGEIIIHPPSADNLVLAIRRFQLDRYISEIKLLFYHLPAQINSFIWPADLENIQKHIRSGLDQWLADSSSMVPKANAEESLVRHCENLKLELQYHAVVTLLYQPSQVFRFPTQHALSLCHQSSSRRLRIYNYLNSEEQLYYSWRNIHGIFSSGATIIYCFWASRGLQNTIPFSDALRDLRTCSNLLSIGGQWWPSVRKGKESFEKAMDLTIKGLSRLERHSSPTPLDRRPSHPVPSSALESMSDNQGRMNESTQISATENAEILHPICKLQVMFLPHIYISFFFLVYRTYGLQTVQDSDPVAVDNLNASLFGDGAPSDGPEIFGIDPAMERFLTEYLQGDWGWDPFSGTVCTLRRSIDLKE